MRVKISSVSACVALISTFASLPAAAQAVSTVTVYAWPMSAAAPTPFAKVLLDSPTTAKLEEYTLPKVKDDEIVRVGLYDRKTKAWLGVAAAASSFTEDSQKKLTLHVDDEGQVFYVGYGAVPKKEDVNDVAKKTKKRSKPKTQKALEREERERQRDLKAELKRKKRKGIPIESEEPFLVDVVQKRAGPLPTLNKPVVLTSDGKVEGAPEVDQRSFLQKYWWAIAIFLVIQVVGGGGGKE